jgi:hypothetical protein
MTTLWQKIESNKDPLIYGYLIYCSSIILCIVLYIHSFCFTDMCYSRPVIENESFQEYSHTRLTNYDIIIIIKMWLVESPIFKDTCSLGSTGGLCEHHKEYERIDFYILINVYFVAGLIIYLTFVGWCIHTTDKKQILATRNQEILNRQMMENKKKKDMEMLAWLISRKGRNKKIREPVENKIRVTYNKKKTKEGTDCVICYQEFNKNVKMGTLKCHCPPDKKYHYACISKWLSRKRSQCRRGMLTCPSCTSEI